jgi:elongator complex protein 2
LFGHDSELICTASTAQRPCYLRHGNAETNKPNPNCENENEIERTIFLASSCKARDAEQAAIRLWDVSNGTCAGELKDVHQSTVVTLDFSNDGRYLASSGKDRRLAIWQRNTKNNTNSTANNSSYTALEPAFQLAVAKTAAHKRIIWSLHFCPQNPSILATGSRDGFVKIWKVTPSTDDDSGTASIDVMHMFEPASKRKSGSSAEAVTAVSFCPSSSTSESSLLAVGLDSGMIELWSVPLVQEAGVHGGGPFVVKVLEENICHCSTVKKIVWRPQPPVVQQPMVDVDNEEEAPNNKATFATCGADHTVRIFEADVI